MLMNADRFRVKSYATFVDHVNQLCPTRCWKLVPKATSGNSAMQGHSAMHGAISCARVFSYAGHSAKHGFSVVIGAIWTCISIGLRSLQNGQSSEKHCT